MGKSKKGAAKLMYFEGYTRKQIAALLGISEQTVSKYKKEGKWAEEMKLNNEIELNNELHVKQVLNYQIKTMKAKVEEWEKEGSLNFVEKGEIDALSKLYSIIKKKDVEWTTYIKIIKEFMQYLQQANLKVAKEVLEISNQFLNEVRSNS